MKKLLFVLLTLSPALINAQSWNPSIRNATITPSTVVEPASNGSAQIEVWFSNTFGDSMPLIAEPLKITMTFSKGGLNLHRGPNPALAVSGTKAQYFNYIYNPAGRTLYIIQNQTIPGDSGTLIFDYISTGTSTTANPQNGMNTNLIPAPYMGSTNVQTDDNVSLFTSTRAISLPAELLEFTGKSLVIGNKLFWTTISERNTHHFNLYHGKEIQDMKILTEIPTRAINGESNIQLNYNYLHANPEKGHNYYRLSTVDIDGKENIHSTINLFSQDESTLSIYPNPSTDFIHLNYRNGELDMINITLSDLNGKVLYDKRLVFENGMFTEVIPVHQLAAGTYLLKLTNYEGYDYSQKITKE